MPVAYHPRLRLLLLFRSERVRLPRCSADQMDLCLMKKFSRKFILVWNTVLLNKSVQYTKESNTSHRYGALGPADTEFATFLTFESRAGLGFGFVHQKP